MSLILKKQNLMVSQILPLSISPNLQKERVGDYLRNKVQWNIIQLKKKG